MQVLKWKGYFNSLVRNFISIFQLTENEGITVTFQSVNSPMLIDGFTPYIYKLKIIGLVW